MRDMGSLHRAWLAEELNHGRDETPTWRRLVLHKAERIRTFEAQVLPIFLAWKPTSFLEIGCGLGYASALVKAALPRCRVVASDLVPAYLRHTERVGQFMEGKADAYVVAPAEALPFQDGEFEAIFFQMVLYRTADPVRAILEVGRVLAPGGVWVAVERAEPWLWSALARRHYAQKNRLTGCHEQAWTRRDWMLCFRHAGLKPDFGWLSPGRGRWLRNAVRAEHLRIVVSYG